MLPLLKTITNAKESIDFAIYGMRNQTTLLDAIEKSKNRGINVRGVVDSDRWEKLLYINKRIGEKDW